ncbi:hypothetical protein CKQ90_36110, partial [Klebsiella pneumoniae]
SRYVLTNNVGIAGGLAWELKRSDINMFDKQGERIPAAQPLRPDQQRWDRRRPGLGAEAKRY